MAEIDVSSASVNFLILSPSNLLELILQYDFILFMGSY